jgi:hypothetical protein
LEGKSRTSKVICEANILSRNQHPFLLLGPNKNRKGNPSDRKSNHLRGNRFVINIK